MNEGEYTTRLACLGDAPFLSPLVKQYRVEMEFGQDNANPLAFVRDAISSAHSDVILAVSMEQEILGFLFFTYSCACRSMRQSLQIVDFWVHPLNRTRGVASVLLRSAEDFAKKHGLGSLYLCILSDRQGLSRFYRERGWIEADLIYLRKPTTEVMRTTHERR